MTKVRYTIYPDLAKRFIDKQEDVFTFILDTHFLNPPKKMPPYDILNQLFMRNPDLASGRTADWEPFQISEDEYITLIDRLTKINGLPFFFEQPPDNISNGADWLMWQGVTNYGPKFVGKYEPHSPGKGIK